MNSGKGESLDLSESRELRRGRSWHRLHLTITRKTRIKQCEWDGIVLLERERWKWTLVGGLISITGPARLPGLGPVLHTWIAWSREVELDSWIVGRGPQGEVWTGARRKCQRFMVISVRSCSCWVATLTMKWRCCENEWGCCTRKLM